MTFPILTLAIRDEHDTVSARQRSRQIARLLGFETQDQTRIATAVSEIARNAFRYASAGRVDFSLDGDASPQAFVIRVSDEGPGIPNLQQVLDGRYQSSTGLGMGIVGARRLMDLLEITCNPGTVVILKKLLPPKAPRFDGPAIAGLIAQLPYDHPATAYAELDLQNQELLRALDELRKRQEELTHVNNELEDTNRGVVALYAELDERAQHLRQADALKTKFLSNMSHEFRSPLNSILALTGLLTSHADGHLNAEQHHQVGFIRKAADDLYELVNDLLDLAKVEAGKVEIKPAPFEVANLLGTLRGMLRPLSLNTAVTLTFDPADGLPVMFSDAAKVSQILRNFISNALKFTEQGEVRVKAEVQGDRMVFAVSDTGIGIDPADFQRIFQEFAQVDNHLQRRVRGTGLGLPLSKKLAHLLGGDIQLTSQPGQGSTFLLEIPIRIGSHDDPPPLAAERSQKAAVLIVERRLDTSLLYRNWLIDSEFRPICVPTVRDAEEMLARERPAAIVLDGWHFINALKASHATRDIPVIVATTPEESEECVLRGVNEYFYKPATETAFVEAIRRATGRLAPSCVLIVDDDEKDRYLLKHRLRDTSLAVIEAASGAEGIDKAINAQPLLIFLDLAMPGMDGLETLRTLGSDARTRDIPVVIHTSKQLSPDEREAIAGFGVVFLSKDQLSKADCLHNLRLQLGDRGAMLA